MEGLRSRLKMLILEETSLGSLSSLSATNFLETLAIVISKNFLKFLNYTLQNIQKKYILQKFLQ